MSSNLLSKVLSVALIFLASTELCFGANTAKPKVSPTVGTLPDATPATGPVVAQAASPLPPGYSPPRTKDQILQNCLDSATMFKPKEKDALTNADGDTKQEYCEIVADITHPKRDKADQECKDMAAEIKDLISKCPSKVQNNVYACFSAPGTTNPNIMKTALETYALTRGFNASLAMPPASDSSGGVNCELSPEDCEKKSDRLRDDVKRAQEKIVSADREASEKDSRHKESMASIEKEGTSAQQEWDRKKIAKNAEMQNKEIEIDRQTSALKVRKKEIQREQDAIVAQLSQAQNAARLELIKVDGTSEVNDCTGRANTSSKGSTKSKVAGGLGNAVGSSKVAAWQAVYKQCQTEYQTKRSVLSTQFTTQIDTLNKGYKQTLEDLAENALRIEQQTTAMNNTFQAQKDQLSTDEKAYYTDQIRIRKKYDEENQNDIARKNNDLKEKANLNAELAQKQKHLNAVGNCPVKSSGSTSIETDKDNCSRLQEELDTYQDINYEISEDEAETKVNRVAAKAAIRDSNKKGKGATRCCSSDKVKRYCKTNVEVPSTTSSKNGR